MNVSFGRGAIRQAGRDHGPLTVAHYRSRASAELEPAIFFQEYLAKDFGSQDAINGFATAEPHL